MYQALQGEGRLGQRPYGQTQEEQGAVVSGRPIEVNGVTGSAAVDEDPFAGTSHRDGHRLHGGAAVGAPISGAIIDMDAPQAGGAVVAVGGAGSGHRNIEAAVPASE